MLPGRLGEARADEGVGEEADDDEARPDDGDELEDARDDRAREPGLVAKRPEHHDGDDEGGDRGRRLQDVDGEQRRARARI
jgi:hypothetical protein